LDCEGGDNMQLTMEQIAQYAAKAWGISLPLSDEPGLYPQGGITTSGRDTQSDILIKAVAIAWAESHGETTAHNPKWPDDSWGLWQINMRGDMGVNRRRQWGLQGNAQLMDPTINAKAAHDVWAGAGRSFSPWSTFTNKAYIAHVPAARNAVTGGLQSDPTTDVGTVLGDLFQPIFDFFKEGALRVGGFVGGAGLIVMAIVLIAKRGVK
jgi:hypothetical protein